MTKQPRREDRRVRRTRRQLQDALRELIRHKPYDKITKVDIVNEADISRATFYLHYDSVDELLIQCFSALADDVSDHMDESGADYVPIADLVDMLFQSVWANRLLYREIKDTMGFPAVIHQQVLIMIPIIKTTLDATIISDGSDLTTYQVAGALSTSALWWIKNDFSPSAQDMTTSTLDQLANTFPRVFASLS